MTQVKPFPELSTQKKEQVEEMFDNIAPKYDFLNRFLSFNIDKKWRKVCINSIADIEPKKILDIATGTGDLAIEASRLNPTKLVGIDISEKMMVVGRKKLKNLNLDEKYTFLQADAENLPFDDNNFDAATVGFGVRNFQNLDKGLSDIYRVLKPNGKFAVLEFSRPNTFPFKYIYNFYSKYILPLWGRLISGHNIAYEYLPQSVAKFAEGEEFLGHMKKAGFKNLTQKRLTLGICTVYVGTK